MTELSREKMLRTRAIATKKRAVSAPEALLLQTTSERGCWRTASCQATAGVK
jgi:hypothetical protein